MKSEKNDIQNVMVLPRRNQLLNGKDRISLKLGLGTAITSGLAWFGFSKLFRVYEPNSDEYDTMHEKFKLVNNNQKWINSCMLLFPLITYFSIRSGFKQGFNKASNEWMDEIERASEEKLKFK